jgi:hypothetical protein
MPSPEERADSEATRDIGVSDSLGDRSDESLMERVEQIGEEGLYEIERDKPEKL